MQTKREIDLREWAEDANTPPTEYRANMREVFALLDEAREDERNLDRTLSTLRELLAGVAEGLKGPPPDLMMHDWSDLPKLATEMRAALNADLHERERLVQLAHEIAAYGVHQPRCTQADGTVVCRCGFKRITDAITTPYASRAPDCFLCMDKGWGTLVRPDTVPAARRVWWCRCAMGAKLRDAVGGPEDISG